MNRKKLVYFIIWVSFCVAVIASSLVYVIVKGEQSKKSISNEQNLTSLNKQEKIN